MTSTSLSKDYMTIRISKQALNTPAPGFTGCGGQRQQGADIGLLCLIQTAYDHHRAGVAERQQGRGNAEHNNANQGVKATGPGQAV